MGLSRLYLGVHYPKDVAAGLALGIAAVFVCPILWNRFDHRKMLAIMTGVSFLLTIALGQQDLYKAFGLLVGFWAGIQFERRFVSFSNQVSTGKKILRVLLGLFLLGGRAIFARPVVSSAFLVGCGTVCVACVCSAGFISDDLPQSRILNVGKSESQSFPMIAIFPPGGYNRR